MLHGRDAERLAIAQLLDGARESRSGVLVLRGEAGVGKSALLADAVARAADMRVVRAVGVESEAELAYAGVHQIAWPLLDRIAEIPAPQAGALQGALGLTTAAGFDRFLVSAAVLSLLAAAAEVRPLLCVVDDAHWLDEPSADALAFAARRLQAEPVALLFSARSSEARPFAASGLPELMLAGLESDAATAVLAESTGGELSAAVRVRILEAAGGNPLALRELPRALTADQRAGETPLGDHLPLTSTLEQMFLERIRRLPRGAALLFVLAAAEDTGEPALILDAAAALDIGPADVEAAEATRLIGIDERGVAFHHPLVRTAVYRAASFAQRQAVHRALADQLHGEAYSDRRAWHRAATVVGFDADVAGELEASAERARRRSGFAAAAAALERAAALTADEEHRARRLVAAADAAWQAGHPDRSPALLERARRLTTAALLRADIDHVRALIEVGHGVPAEAHRLLLDAEAQIEASDRTRAAALLVAAGHAAAFAGDTAAEIEAGRRAARLLCDATTDLFELSMMAGIARLLEGHPVAAVPILRDAISAAEASPNPRRLLWAGSCSLYLLDQAGARRYFAREVARARADGAISTLAVALQMRALAEAQEGRFASAAANATEALRFARETGQENAACHALAVLARTAAFLGREDACRSRAAEVLRQAEARGLALQAGMATWALGDLELSSGRAEKALEHYERIASTAPGAAHRSYLWLTVPDRVEAAARTGRTDTAADELDAFERWAIATGSQAHRALLARCRALQAPGDRAFAHFEDALTLHLQAGRPFDAARTRLLYGERLRRCRRRRDARAQIRPALETFEQLSAHGWAERARAELRASGESARKRDPSTLDQLTAQELQIARFVAAGATNREVAAQLFLSPRTIDFHLRNVYAKLGIASRHDLAALGVADEPAATPATDPAALPVRA